VIRPGKPRVFTSVNQGKSKAGPNMSDTLQRVSVRSFLKSLDRAQRAYLISGVASELAAHRGRVISSNELLEAVYGCSTREPEDAAIGLKVAIYKLRKSGFNIVTHPWRGYCHTHAA
jgi:DNA-binding response OmpR family regulator